MPADEAEYRRLGLGRYIIDRPSHPQAYVSSWPLSSGFNTLGASQHYRHPSLNYNSVLVVAIGNHYDDGVWWRLQDMLRYTEQQGYLAALEEVDDMSMMPTDAIGIMRGCAAMLALDAGFEWCLMVDTDVHVEKDTLVRLLKHDRPIVYPMLNVLKDVVMGSPISSPVITQSGMGLQAVRWAAMSCMLFSTKVFNCLDHYSWHGHDRHFSQSLAHFGHRILIDTDTVVDVTRGPARHSGKQFDEMMGDIKRAHDSFQNDDRNRKPPPGFDPVFGEGTVDKHGVYWAVDGMKRHRVNGPMADGVDPDVQ